MGSGVSSLLTLGKVCPEYMYEVSVGLVQSFCIYLYLGYCSGSTSSNRIIMVMIHFKCGLCKMVLYCCNKPLL